jgi:plasmid stability protein
MPALYVRNVSEELYTRLKQQAQMHRRSLGAEVIALLEWSVEEIDRTLATPLESIRYRRFFEPASVDAPDSTRLLCADRER